MTNLADHVSNLMEGLTMADLDRMRPADRERFAALCDTWCLLAGGVPKAGTTAERQTAALARLRASPVAFRGGAGEHAAVTSGSNGT